MPSLSSVTVLLTWSFLVSGFLTIVTQQIHSFLASGVMSSHAASALESAIRASSVSAGKSWTTPPGIFLAIGLFYGIGHEADCDITPLGVEGRF